MPFLFFFDPIVFQADSKPSFWLANSIAVIQEVVDRFEDFLERKVMQELGVFG
jgi:hypothetical protein